MIRVPLATNSYQSRSRPLSSQRLVNLFGEVQPDDAKAKIPLFGTPGLVRHATAGDGPIRGLHVMKGALYAVSGTSLYRIMQDGTASRLGPVSAASDVVSLADIGTQLIIAGGGRADVYNGTTVSPVTDPDFPGASAVAVLDSFGIFVSPSSGKFGVSKINDLTDYDALDYATAESSPDDLVTVAVDHREVWLFGTGSIEVWQNTGAADFPLERLAGATVERGTAAAGSVAKLDGSLFWLGDDRLIYRAEGYTPKRVSQHAIEGAISSYARVDDAVAFGYVQGGHAFYVLTFPTADATWVYDAATGLWHERQSGTAGRWRAQCSAAAYGKVFVGDCQDGRIYALDPDAGTEDGATIVRSATSPPVHASGARAIAKRFELECEVGVGLVDGQGADPQAMLQWSDDGGFTWSAEHWRSLGALGDRRRRAVWTRLGQFRQRVWRVTITDPVPVTIYGALSDIEGGNA